jgi:NitT/TauT family transport system ATP-binding protein
MATDVGTATGEIVVDNLSVVYENERKGTAAVRDLSFQVKPGEFVCLLGTTGCGKSTVLNVIAGFVKPTSGTVCVNGHQVHEPSPDRGIVFQQYALFPWKTVRQNIGFGPRMLGKSAKEVDDLIKRYVAAIGLSGFEDKYPLELSGGMAQRVALARALANDPAVLLMDEPFGSLDAQIRLMMQELLLRVWEGAGKTVVFVTHDVDEAVFLADRVLVMTARPGQIKAEIPVNLTRPRSYDIVTSQEFLAIKRQALHLIREESLKALNTSI